MVKMELLCYGLVVLLHYFSILCAAFDREGHLRKGDKVERLQSNTRYRESQLFPTEEHLTYNSRDHSGRRDTHSENTPHHLPLHAHPRIQPRLGVATRPRNNMVPHQTFEASSEHAGHIRGRDISPLSDAKNSEELFFKQLATKLIIELGASKPTPTLTQQTSSYSNHHPPDYGTETGPAVTTSSRYTTSPGDRFEAEKALWLSGSGGIVSSDTPGLQSFSMPTHQQRYAQTQEATAGRNSIDTAPLGGMRSSETHACRAEETVIEEMVYPNTAGALLHESSSQEYRQSQNDKSLAERNYSYGRAPRTNPRAWQSSDYSRTSRNTAAVLPHQISPLRAHHSDYDQTPIGHAVTTEQNDHNIETMITKWVQTERSIEDNSRNTELFCNANTLEGNTLRTCKYAPRTNPRAWQSDYSRTSRDTTAVLPHQISPQHAHHSDYDQPPIEHAVTTDQNDHDIETMFTKWVQTERAIEENSRDTEPFVSANTLEGNPRRTFKYSSSNTAAVLPRESSSHQYHQTQHSHAHTEHDDANDCASQANTARVNIHDYKNLHEQLLRKADVHRNAPGTSFSQGTNIIGMDHNDVNDRTMNEGGVSCADSSWHMAPIIAEEQAPGGGITTSGRGTGSKTKKIRKWIASHLGHQAPPQQYATMPGHISERSNQPRYSSGLPTDEAEPTAASTSTNAATVGGDQFGDDPRTARSRLRSARKWISKKFGSHTS